MTPIVPLAGFKFGCDPELPIFDQVGKPVPATGIIPGTKAEPYPVPGGAVQRDGMLAEFNIDPAETFEEFDNNIKKVLTALRGFLPKGHTFKPVSSVVFDKEVFEAQPDDAKELGCTPDFDAWTGEINPPPDRGNTNPYLATAAGHIHIGWTEDADLGDLQHVVNCRDLVKQLDWYLGAWSVKQDTDPTRRQLYGKAGACRYKPYGVEYRVLSNFWVMDPSKRLSVWNRTQQAIKDMSRIYMPDRAIGSYNDRLVKMINTTAIDSRLLSNYNYPVTSISRDGAY